MLSIRVIGSKNEIVWFQKILERHNRIFIGDEGFSKLFDLREGPKGRYRIYVRIVKANLKHDKR